MKKHIYTPHTAVGLDSELESRNSWEQQTDFRDLWLGTPRKMNLEPENHHCLKKNKKCALQEINVSPWFLAYLSRWCSGYLPNLWQGFIWIFSVWFDVSSRYTERRLSPRGLAYKTWMHRPNQNPMMCFSVFRKQNLPDLYLQRTVNSKRSIGFYGILLGRLTFFVPYPFAEKKKNHPSSQKKLLEDIHLLTYPPNPFIQATAQFRPCPALRGELTSALLKRPGLQEFGRDVRSTWNLMKKSWPENYTHPEVLTLHPGRWTAGSYSHHPWKERNMIWTKPPWL